MRGAGRFRTMPGVIALLLAAVLGFLAGSLPTGYLVAWMKGVDIRKHGSGNIGATNAFRVLGKELGLLVFAVDLLKGLAAVVAGRWLAGDGAVVPPVYGAIAGGITSILGHSFTPWLKFKGGKGVATSLGVIFALSWPAGAVGFATWGAVLFLTRFVSVASMVAAAAIPIVMGVFAGPAERGPLLVFGGLAAALVIARHRSNLARLAAGTEPKIGRKKGA